MGLLGCIGVFYLCGYNIVELSLSRREFKRFSEFTGMPESVSLLM